MEDRELDEVIAEVPAPAPDGDHIDDGVLLRFRAGQLEPSEHARVERHLAACAECRELLAELAQPVSLSLHEAGVQAVLRRRSRWPVRVMAPLAAAAAILLTMVGLRDPATEAPPEYALLGPTGGMKSTRSAEPATTVFEPGGRMQFVLRPQEAVVGEAPDVALFVQGPRGAIARRPELQVDTSEDGALRVRAEVEDVLGPDPGDYRLHLVLGRGLDALGDRPSLEQLAASPQVQLRFVRDVRLAIAKESSR